MRNGKLNWRFEAEETSTGMMFSVYDGDDQRLTEAFISEKDARLIASAPDMLALLKRIHHELVRQGINFGPLIADAEDVIAKAEVQS